MGGYDPDCVCGCRGARGWSDPTPGGNVCMNSDKLADALGYDPLDPWPLSDALVPTDRHWHRRRDPADPGSPELLHSLLCRNPSKVAA